MGNPPAFVADLEAAPAYEEHVHHDRPVGLVSLGGNSNSYARLPQQDEDEQPEAQASSSSTRPTTRSTPTPPTTGGQQPQQQLQQESFLQTLTAPFRRQPHVHCAECDALAETQMRRKHKLQTCRMVSATFMVLFLCLFGFGAISVVNRRH